MNPQSNVQLALEPGICAVLVEPELLIRLIAQLEGNADVKVTEGAFFCESQSADDPIKRRLWIVPESKTAGANPQLWIRDRISLFDTLIHRNIAVTSLVFAGQYPEKVDRVSIRIQRPSDDKSPEGAQMVFKKEIRVLSAPAHIWIDRLGLYDAEGNIDAKKRNDKLTSLAGKYWSPELQHSYITPKFEPVDDHMEKIIEVQAKNLLSKRPSIPPGQLVIVFGPGGSGKTLFLMMLANNLAKVSKQSLISPIPVLVQLTGILHRAALENWLARRGFDKLTLAQLTIFIRAGLITPLLDALDEVVKGEARIGSDEFLDHLFDLVKQGGTSGILACRDYYLTVDKGVVRERAQLGGFPQLLIGPFTNQDTRRFLQLRADLSPEEAKRWADALDREAKHLVDPSLEAAVIRHPVVLATLAEYITSIPAESRANSAAAFRLSTSDIFGPIVDELLKRERQKNLPSWHEIFGDQLIDDWADPFHHRLQRKVLRALTLRVALAGGTHAEDSNREFRHGMFMTTPGLRPSDSAKQVLALLIEEQLGIPRCSSTVPEEEIVEVQGRALNFLADAYSSHILATSDPEPPEGLVFALRHRFYFDYFLADALLEQIETALQSRSGTQLINWCISHNIAGAFATCLDFLASSPKVLQEGLSRLTEFLAGDADEILAGYLLSLGLALFLRRRGTISDRTIERLSFDQHSDLEILMSHDFLPKQISDLRVVSCSFSGLIIDSVDFARIELDSCDFNQLTLSGAMRIANSKFIHIEAQTIVISGNITFQDSLLDFSHVHVAPGSRIEVYDCQVSIAFLNALTQARAIGCEVKTKNMQTLEEPVEQTAVVTVGRRFVNQIMRLMRKHSHADFGVFIDKLKGRTPGPEDKFQQALRLLLDRGICSELRGVILLMTPLGEKNMYNPDWLGRPGYDVKEDFWRPVVALLDKILA